MSALGTAVYPGTFDPVTNGHVDIISRAAKVVGNLIVGVAVTVEKTPMFTPDERVAMLENEISALDGGLAGRISVKPFENLLVDFVEREGASVIIRGLRAVSDFEYEFQMAAMNARLNGRVETLFLMRPTSTNSSRRASSRKSRCWAATSPASCRRARSNASSGAWPDRYRVSHAIDPATIDRPYRPPYVPGLGGA